MIFFMRTTFIENTGIFPYDERVTVRQQYMISETVSDDHNILFFQIKALFDNKLAGLCFIDTNGVLLTMNSCFCEMLGLEHIQLQGLTVADVFPDDNNVFHNSVMQAVQGKLITAQKIQYKNHIFIANFTSVKNTTGGCAGITVALVDVTQFQQAMHKLTLAEERTSFALESAGQWIWDMDIKTNRVWRSPQYTKVLGLKSEIPDGKSISWDIVFAEDKEKAMQALEDVIVGKREIFEAVYRVLRHDGEPIWIMSRGRVVAWDSDGTPARLLATSVDISGQKHIECQLSAIIQQKAELELKLLEANRELRKQSEYDYLTNLPNRRKFSQHLKLEYVHALDNKTPLSILMIDMDYFKAYNDLYGHLAGDQCLTNIGRILSQVITQQDHVVARFGGEEFVALLVDTPQADAALIAQRIIDCISGMNIPHAGSPFSIVTASIGVGTLSMQNYKIISDPYVLLNLADKALYKTKGTGRNGVSVWNTEGM